MIFKISPYKKAIRLFRKRKFLEAIKEFDKAIEIDPRNFEGWFSRGLTKNLLKQYEEATKDFDKAIEIEPEDYTCWRLRGQSKGGLEQYEEAIKDFDKAIEYGPKDYYSWLLRGKSKYCLQQYEEAIKDLDKAIEINPEDNDSWVWRGQSKVGLMQYEEAIKDFDKAIEINPQASDSLGMRGLTYLRSMKYELAEKDFKKAYEINNDEVNFNFNLGRIFYSKKNNYLAIKYYLKALTVNPNSYLIYAYISLAKMELGDDLNSFNDLKKSEELFKENYDKEFFSMFESEKLNKFIKIYEINNDLDRFKKILEYLNKNHKDNRNLFLQGILKFKNGKFYDAISDFLEVYEDDKQNKDCILYLGKAKLELKDYKNALIDFKKYIELDSNDEVEKLIKTCEENLKAN